MLKLCGEDECVRDVKSIYVYKMDEQNKETHNDNIENTYRKYIYRNLKLRDNFYLH